MPTMTIENTDGKQGIIIGYFDNALIPLCFIYRAVTILFLLLKSFAMNSRLWFTLIIKISSIITALFLV